MKKTRTLLIITLIVSMLFMVACGTEPHTLTDEEIAERLQYKQYTPSSDIIEGDVTAVRTINNFLNKNVIVGEDYHEPEVSGEFTYVEDDVCMRYEVSNYDHSYRLLFLYKDDTCAVEPVFSQVRYLDGDKLSTEFKKKDNYNGEAFAWENGNATFVLDRKAGPRCTSIWAYDETKDVIRLIWCNSFDCPIWQNYYNS